MDNLSDWVRLDRTCPHCGKRNDGHTAIDGEPAVPKPGDVSLCFTCGGLGIYTEDAMRKPTDDELFECMQDEQLKRAMFLIKLNIAVRNG